MGTTVTYEITRFDGEKTFSQTYTFPLVPGKTILWGLLTIKDSLDPSLTFTAACRSAVCGACAVRVNGQAMLACETSLDDVIKRFHSYTVALAPLANFPVIRDLAVDWTPHAQRLAAARTWFMPRREFTPATGCRQKPADFQKIRASTGCILCGACASECAEFTADNAAFAAPYVFAKLNRFADDSRDQGAAARVAAALDNGLWRCLHCGECVAKCPKGLAPAQDIAALRRRALRLGRRDGAGARHALAFYHDIQNCGRLNEMMLPLRTSGVGQVWRHLPVALRLLRRGKINPLSRSRPVAGIDGVRTIIRAAEEGEK